MMLFGWPVPWWLGLILTALVAMGLWMVVWTLRDWLWTAVDWWRDRRGGEASEQEQGGLCAGCWDDSEHCDGANDMCDCTCGWPDGWAEEELPPERSREELGFTGEQPVLEGVLWEPPGPQRYLTDTLERLEPAWRAEIASALAWWEDLPSGTGFTRAMAASVREAVR